MTRSPSVRFPFPKVFSDSLFPDNEPSYYKATYTFKILIRSFCIFGSDCMHFFTLLMLTPGHHKKVLEIVSCGAGQALRAGGKVKVLKSDQGSLLLLAMIDAAGGGGITLTEIDWLKTREVLGGGIRNPPVYKYDFSVLNLHRVQRFEKN